VARVPLFDFDGTLVDSDVALTAPWSALGVDPDLVPLGLPLGEACARAGVTMEAYLEHYDPGAATPFDGVPALLASLDRWGLASNKERTSGRRELDRLGWSPEVALFSDDFGGQEKQLAPLLDALALDPEDAVYVGDTAHDRACEARIGVPFALAGWNPRARAGARADDLVLGRPSDVLDLLTGARSVP
jgi:phosphoglycolate phosphatase-like HAD superfamily hydrolase